MAKTITVVLNTDGTVTVTNSIHVYQGENDATQISYTYPNAYSTHAKQIEFICGDTSTKIEDIPLSVTGNYSIGDDLTVVGELKVSFRAFDGTLALTKWDSFVIPVEQSTMVSITTAEDNPDVIAQYRIELDDHEDRITTLESTTVLTVDNVGTGEGKVYKEEVSNTAYLKSIKAGTNISITNNTDDITITNTMAEIEWGNITGTLSNQTDLQNELDGKVDENVAIAGATKTKITYDSKGLVTAGTDATTDDIAEGSTNKYFNGKDTDDLPEGSSNKYYSESLFNNSLSTKDTDDLSEGATNLYYTDARARASISETATGLDYNNSTGVISLTSGYEIPTSARLNGIEGDIDDIEESLDNAKEPTGFVNTTDSNISYTDTPTFSISPLAPATDFDYYIHGVKYTISTTKTFTWGGGTPIAEGVWFIYLDNTRTLQATQSFTRTLLCDNAIVSLGYWDNTNTTWIIKADERHGMSMDCDTHYYLHSQFGTVYRTGLAIGSSATADSGNNNAPTTDRQNQFIIGSGTLSDEDLLISIAQQGVVAPFSPCTIPLLYLDGTTWRQQTASFLLTKGTAGQRVNYNKITGSSGAQQQVSVNNRYVLAHVFGCNDITYPIQAIQGQNEYTTRTLARAGATTELNTIITNGLPTPEFKFLYTVIYQTNDGATWDAYGNVKLVSVDSSVEDTFVDWRQATVSSRVAVSVSDHNALTSLQGGTSGEYYHLTSAQQSTLTGGASSDADSLHTHNGKQNTITGGATTIVTSNLTADRLLVSDGSGKVAVSSVTTTNLTDLTDAGQTTLHRHAISYGTSAPSSTDPYNPPVNR